jgi:hypothetical protein
MSNQDSPLFLSVEFDLTAEETAELSAYTNEVEFVGDCIRQASEYGLEAEVAHWALKEMKQNPNLSISDAIWIGFNEWVK